MYRLILLALGGLFLLTVAGLAQYQPWHHEAHQYAYPDDAGALVNSWYQRYLHRTPDPNGEQLGWVKALHDGQTPEHVLAGILGSQEYLTNAGGTAEGFVITLHTDLTGHQPKPQEVKYWMSQLSYGYGNYGYAGPDVNARTAVAYSMLLRYPQSFAAQTPYYPDAYRYKYEKAVYPPYKKNW